MATVLEIAHLTLMCKDGLMLGAATELSSVGPASCSIAVSAGNNLPALCTIHPARIELATFSVLG